MREFVDRFVGLLPIVSIVICRFALLFPAYEMDHGNGKCKGTFYPLLILYSVFFYVLAALGVIGFAWSHIPVFLLSAGEALFVNIWLLLCYEAYMYSRYPEGKSNYTRGKYALTLAMGYSSALTMVIAVILAALHLR